MSGGDSAYAQEIVNDYPRLLVENYCIVASSALLWFDFALTFPDEYRRIWKRNFSGATLVYLLIRYVAIIERIFFVLEVLVWNSSDKVSYSVCGGITHTDDVLLFINYLSFTAFTSLRVYSVWVMDWRPLLFVLPLSLIKPLAVMYENAHYLPIQAGPPFGCTYIYLLPDSTLSDVSILAKATTIAADVILIVLTWIKTFGIHKESRRIGFRTPVSTLVLRDGTAYFLILLIIQMITIISNRIGHSLPIWLVWPYFDQVITVIFLSRFMLDLRGLSFPRRDGRDADTTLHLSDMSDVKFEGNFSSTIVGNFGATLNTHISIPVPHPPAEDSEGSPGTSSDYSLERTYAWEWRDDVEEFSDDPFRAGMQSDDPEKPPELVKVVEAASPTETAMADDIKEGGAEIQEETRLGEVSPV